MCNLYILLFCGGGREGVCFSRTCETILFGAYFALNKIVSRNPYKTATTSLLNVVYICAFSLVLVL